MPAFREGDFMRTIIPFKDRWMFTKEGVTSPVTLPHTWNAVDGADGGNDYYRGVCTYCRSFDKPSAEESDRVFLEFRGVNSSASIFCNGILCGTHDGGYSTFRVEITDALQDENELRVEVDNRYNDRVYPQRADFTFYGGIYRDVNLIVVQSCHFALDRDGAEGLILQVQMKGKDALVSLRATVDDLYDSIVYRITEAESGKQVAEAEGERTSVTLSSPHLWDGVNDPFLYRVTATVYQDRTAMDEVSYCFGCRSFVFDAQKGFFLNGRPYPLHGVSRHQDRNGVGNALTKEMHEEDFALIREMGANAVRLAHYQHDPYVYDICDQLGLIAWAEIPYISEHMPNAKRNAEQQLCELVHQHQHHACIACWALSNEITASGYSEDLYDAHVYLNDLAHALDPTRPTAVANAFMLPKDSPLLEVPDLIGYNLYFGWYLGNAEQNGEFLDSVHEKHPDRPLALTEYGADSFLQWQTAKPSRGDYTEQYQAEYHRVLLDTLESRPYLWGGFVWNMFDFAADARNEGGIPGRNGKGLITFDRKTKKDAFYLYKAYWSDEPFVHLCGSRYVDRAEDVTTVTVYSNQPSVTLYRNGERYMEQTGKRVFTFTIPNIGTTELKVTAGACADSIRFRKVSKPNPAYTLPGREIVNWLDREVLPQPDGHFSIYDTIGELCTVPEGHAFVMNLMGEGNGTNIHVVFDENMLEMSKGETIAGIIVRKNIRDPKSTLKELNAQLNRIARA